MGTFLWALLEAIDPWRLFFRLSLSALCTFGISFIDAIKTYDTLFVFRFMWIMGVSLVLSFHALRHHEVSSMKVLFKIVRRSVILFALGLFVSNCKWSCYVID